ncbi:argininosuccinate lyase [Rhodobacteraceae bacterium KMM 6894]|nr:argininosuccinate lyase [Rhodobacteraceae bacterium KMM 6894]
MKVIFVLTAVLGLTACGVDGPPVRPAAKTSVGSGSKDGSASVTNDWISGNVSVHVGAAV